MYVCVCHAVTETALRAAACAGVRDLQALAMHTGCGTSCGCCRDFASELLTQHAQAMDAPPTGENVLRFRQVA